MTDELLCERCEQRPGDVQDDGSIRCLTCVENANEEAEQRSIERFYADGGPRARLLEQYHTACVQNRSAEQEARKA